MTLIDLFHTNVRVCVCICIVQSFTFRDFDVCPKYTNF